MKRGAKFLIRGTERNHKIPELQFAAGQFFGTKLGLADEHEVYRNYFVVDPDTDIWKEGPDRDINPDGKDHYLVARDWYLKANDTLEEDGVEQHRMELALFVAYPYRALIENAKEFQIAGVKDQHADMSTQSQEERDELYNNWATQCQEKWVEAYDDWTNVYGRKRIVTSGGGTVILERDDAVLEELAELDEMTFEDKERWQEQYRSMTSYPYWKRHCEIERRAEMTRARYYLAEGRRLFRNIQDFEGSRKYLEEGLTLLEDVMKQYESDESDDNVVVVNESDTVEEALKAIIIYQNVMSILAEPLPEDYPLKWLWEDPDLDYTREDLEQRFHAWNG